MVVKLLSHGLLALQIFAAFAAGESPRYKDPTAPVDDRVADLLGRMTIEDKTAQLIQGVLPIINPIGLSRSRTRLIINRRYH